MEKICLNCSKKFSHRYERVKHCSVSCGNISRRKDPAMSRRQKAKLGVKKAVVYKKYHCSICEKTEVKRKTKFCKPCRYKTSKRIFAACIVCGDETVGWKNKDRKFCSRECMFLSYKGAGNPHYIDGRKPENSRIRDSKEYKQWRTAVFERDKYTCQHCHQKGGELHADHIKLFSKFPALRLDVSNGRTLCKECHMKTDTYLYRAKKAEIIERSY